LEDDHERYPLSKKQILRLKVFPEQEEVLDDTDEFYFDADELWSRR